MGSIVDAAVAVEMAAQHLPGMTVALAKNGTVLYAQGYGYADLTTCTPMAADAQMQIGSLTKQFTAVAVLQLQQSGKVDIDQPVVTYLPTYAFDARITLRMLLNQTSGLQDYVLFPELQQYITGAPEAIALNAIVQHSLHFAPGTAYEYSNSNYFILGSVLEAVTGSSYPDYLLTKVFAPAGLASTFYQRPAQSAAPYVPGTDGKPTPGVIPDSSAYFSAGALWSNVQDLSTWDAALLGGKELPPSLVTLMMTPSGQKPFNPQDGTSYGMGLIAGGTLAGHPFVWHNGQTISYTSFNGMLTDDGFTLTVLTNYPTNEDFPLYGFGKNLIGSLCTASGC
ncbi:MAG TPA: serine hydrolase domain-containing protein [Steroidobacteraceae bacterium]